MTDFYTAARFSPGPWWGFNGVDDLELSRDVLTRKHYRVFRGKVPVTSPLSSVEVVSYEVLMDKQSGQTKWVRLTLLIDRARRTFTTTRSHRMTSRAIQRSGAKSPGTESPAMVTA